ncbi:unnamed protein product [Chironomus riparius]|uniref:Uncharacterized protein n=1 Tax=Chironomus riparius TaxID=315576 RepID=A0A9N9RR81_9DIPT|nr:unnamed protein product [Chironomus riparius]
MPLRLLSAHFLGVSRMIKRNCAGFFDTNPK